MGGWCDRERLLGALNRRRNRSFIASRRWRLIQQSSAKWSRVGHLQKLPGELRICEPLTGNTRMTDCLNTRTFTTRSPNNQSWANHFFSQHTRQYNERTRDISTHREWRQEDFESAGSTQVQRSSLCGSEVPQKEARVWWWMWSLGNRAKAPYYWPFAVPSRDYHIFRHAGSQVRPAAG